MTKKLQIRKPPLDDYETSWIWTVENKIEILWTNLDRTVEYYKILPTGFYKLI